MIKSFIFNILSEEIPKPINQYWVLYGVKVSENICTHHNHPHQSHLRFCDHHSARDRYFTGWLCTKLASEKKLESWLQKYLITFPELRADEFVSVSDVIIPILLCAAPGNPFYRHSVWYYITLNFDKSTISTWRLTHNLQQNLADVLQSKSWLKVVGKNFIKL